MSVARLKHEYLPATGQAQQELVLLHGWGANKEMWRPMLVQLRSWANVTLIDLPGAAPGIYPPDDLKLKTTLAGILECSPELAVFVGWSLGGQLALEILRTHRDRVAGLVTICTNPKFVAAHGWEGMAEEKFSQFHASATQDMKMALRRFDSLQSAGSPRARDLRRQFLQQRLASEDAGLLQGLVWLEKLDLRDVVSACAVPQLHLFAGADNLVPASVVRGMHTLVDGQKYGEIKMLPSASHAAPMDCEAEIVATLKSFLRQTQLLRDSIEQEVEITKGDVAASFSRAAQTYDSAAQLQREVGNKLLHRLNAKPPAAHTVLDLGCGTGFFSGALRERFPHARYIGLDLAQGMVEFARGESLGASSSDWVVADAEALPLATGSVDLIFSSLAVQWCNNVPLLFSEMSRVLRPGGRCIFTTLGPATLQELRESWATVDDFKHVNTFLSADALQAAVKHIEGVELNLDIERIEMRYKKVRELLVELKKLGAHNMNRHRASGLTSRRAMQGMLRAYEQWRSDGVLPATYEVYFGELEFA